MQKSLTWDDLLPGDYICYQHNFIDYHKSDKQDTGHRMEMFTHWLDDRRLVAGVLNSFDTKKCWLLSSAFETIIYGEDAREYEREGIPAAPQIFLDGIRIIRNGETIRAILTDEAKHKIAEGREASRAFWNDSPTREQRMQRLVQTMNIADRLKLLTVDEGITDEKLLEEYELMRRATPETQINFERLYGVRLKALLDIPGYLSIPNFYGGTEIEKLGKR